MSEHPTQWYPPDRDEPTLREFPVGPPYPPMPAHWQRPLYAPQYLAAVTYAEPEIDYRGQFAEAVLVEPPEVAADAPNRLAIVSLVCGILPFPLFAIGFGAAGIRRAWVCQRGLVMSVVGLVLGLVWLLPISYVVGAKYL